MLWRGGKVAVMSGADSEGLGSVSTGYGRANELYRDSRRSSVTKTAGKGLKYRQGSQGSHRTRSRTDAHKQTSPAQNRSRKHTIICKNWNRFLLN